MMLQVAYNDNAQLVDVLYEEGLISDPETIFSDESTDFHVELYEGKDNWYFQFIQGFRASEVIVPKTVSKDDAIDIAIYTKLKDEVSDYRTFYIAELCEPEYEKCLDSCEEWRYDEEEYNECFNKCVEEYDRCKEYDVENYGVVKLFNETVRDLQEKRILPIGCFSGKEAGHPDIDEICVFRL